MQSDPGEPGAAPAHLEGGTVMGKHRLALSVVALLALTSALPAADIRGRIAGFDPNRRELQIEARLRRPPLLFVLAPDVQVLIGQKPAPLADLVPGQRVHLVYDLQDGRYVARAVHILGAVAEPAMPPPGGENDIAGVLQRVALTDREVVVVGPGPKGPQTEITIAVPEGARILKDGKVVALEALTEGVQVRVRVERREGRPPVAVVIQVGVGAAMPAEGGAVIPKIRLGLQILDKVLEQMEQQKRQPPK
jgi:hypothetical protein